MSNEKIKAQTLARLRERLGDEYVDTNAAFIEAQWEYLVQIGMIDPETDETGAA